MPICKKVILLENVTIEVKFFSKISLQFWNSFRFSVLTANYHLNEPKVSTHKTYMYSKKNLMCSVKKILENSNFFFFFINAFCFIMFMTQLYSWLINQMYEVLARTFLLFLCSMINLANAWFGVQKKVTVCAMEIRLFCWTMQFCLLLYTCKVS